MRNLTIVPDMFGVPVENSRIEILFNEKTLLVNTSNNLNRYSNRCLKSFFDVIVGIFLCVPVLPLLFIIALLVKKDTPGPILHVAKRIGKHGELFSCYKFRTMYVNADDILQKYLAENP